MNPSQALRTLCERFLEQHQEYLESDLDEIADRIMGSSIGMSAPYPKTAKALSSRIESLLEMSGKLDRVKRKFLAMDEEDLDGTTLEELAATLED
jgi:hypothetical protein